MTSSVSSRFRDGVETEIISSESETIRTNVIIKEERPERSPAI